MAIRRTNWGSSSPTVLLSLLHRLRPAIPGLNGGALVINAGIANLSDPSGAGLYVNTQGGPGGNGQPGYPAWPGPVGADGQNGYNRDIYDPGTGGSTEVVAFAGTRPGDGTNALPGQAGGPGGMGGNDGALIITSSVHPVAGVDPFLSTASAAAGGPPGPGGFGGAGAKGGDPGAPSRITRGGPYDYFTASGKSGKDSVAGAQGAAGARGNANFATINYTADAIDVYREMTPDGGMPNSLQVRAHRLIDEAFRDLATGKIKVLSDGLGRLRWLGDLAAPDSLNYPDVASRLAALESFVDRGNGDALDLSSQILRMPVDAATAALKMLTQVGTDDFTTQRPTYAAMADYVAGAGDVRADIIADLNGPLGEDPFLPVEKALFNAVSRLAAADESKLPPEDTEGGEAILLELLGGEALAGEAAVGAAAEATLGGILLAESAMGPPGIILAAATFMAFAIYELFFSGLLDFGESVSAKEFREAIAAHDTQRAAWQRDETSRKNEEQANANQNPAELGSSAARPRARKRQSDYEEPILTFGFHYLGVLVDLDVDETTGDRWGVFDCWLLPEITSPAALAAFLLATYKP